MSVKLVKIIVHFKIYVAWTVSWCTCRYMIYENICVAYVFMFHLSKSNLDVFCFIVVFSTTGFIQNM